MFEKVGKESQSSFVPPSFAYAGVGSVTSWYQSLRLGIFGRVLD